MLRVGLYAKPHSRVLLGSPMSIAESAAYIFDNKCTQYDSFTAPLLGRKSKRHGGQENTCLTYSNDNRIVR